MIRPGLMVSLKSTVAGGIHYSHSEIKEDGNTAEWKTTRVTDDPAEHDRAVKARGLALTTIRKLCASTAFGLLCPEDRESELDEACKVAQGIAREHNATANYTRIGIYVLKGRIASTDEQAARAIGEEVRSLIEAMNAGVDKLDPEAIREAANKAKQMSTMLSAEQSEKVNDAIEAARKAARTIVKRIEKNGEEAAVVLMDIQRGALEKARIAFLDLESDEAPAIEPLPAVTAQRFADMGEDDEEVKPASVATGDEWLAAKGAE